MKANARKAFNKLKKLGCPVREWHGNDRGHFWIDAESDINDGWLDYWSNYQGHDKLNEILNSHDLYWEWYNPGYGCVYDI
jgi:hypothetical protein